MATITSPSPHLHEVRSRGRARCHPTRQAFVGELCRWCYQGEPQPVDARFYGPVLPRVPKACPHCGNPCLTDHGREVSCLPCGWEGLVVADAR